MEIGVTSFAETTPDPATGATISARERLHEVVEEIILADRVGLAVYGLGEHHRPDFAASAPIVVLAAAASRTSDIRLSTAVTVLSSADPVRVFQDFATLDLLSDGRAEIMAGRGSFIESFPLFGNDLDDYDALFAEKLDLLLKLRESERITWSGRFRPAIEDRGVYPRPLQEPLPVWIAVGGSPNSVARAGRLGLPLAIAIIGGTPARFRPLVDLYREAGLEAGRDPASLKVAVHAHGFIADTAEAAAEPFYGPYAQVMTQLGRERGWPPMSRQQYEQALGPRGHLLVGDPEQVAQKILAQHDLFGLDRFMLHISVGTLPHDRVMRAIELLGTRVMPIVQAELARRSEAAA